MFNIFFVTPNLVRETTSINNNVSDKYVISAIREVQKNDLYNLLGKKLYKKLEEIVEDDTIFEEENEVYYELMQIIQQFVIYSTVKRIFLNVYAKITNAGVVKNSDETYESVSLDELKYIKNNYDNLINKYYRNIQEFLIENYNKLPEVLSIENYKSVVTKMFSNNACGLWLGGSRGKCIKFKNLYDLMWPEKRYSKK